MTPSLPMGPERLYEGLDLKSGADRDDFRQRVRVYMRRVKTKNITQLAHQASGRDFGNRYDNIRAITDAWIDGAMKEVVA